MQPRSAIYTSLHNFGKVLRWYKLIYPLRIAEKSEELNSCAMSGLLLGNKEFAATWTTSSHLTTTKWRCLGYLENSTCCPLRGWIILMSNIRFVHKQRSYKVSILKSIFYLIRCSYWPFRAAFRTNIVLVNWLLWQSTIQEWGMWKRNIDFNSTPWFRLVCEFTQERHSSSSCPSSSK